MEAPQQENAFGLLVQINKELHRLQANTTNPDTRLAVKTLCRRTQQCLETGGHPREVSDIKIKFDELVFPVNQEASYPVFIRRLRNIDAGNLLGCYLPSSSWFSRESQWRYGGNNGPHICGDADYHDRHDCPQTIPLTALYEAFNEEHAIKQLWLTRVISLRGTIRPSQPASPWSDYFRKVAFWSIENQSPDEAWDFWRIVECLRENYERANHFQDPYQKFLDYGLDYTLARLVQDCHDRVSERIAGEIEGFRKDLLIVAVKQAQLYYFANDDCFTPHDWVKDVLAAGGRKRTPREALGPVPNITMTRDWADVHEARGGLVTVSCLHADTGEEWHPHVLGIDNGKDAELDASLRANRAHKAEYEARSVKQEAESEQPDTTEAGNGEKDDEYEADDEEEEDEGGDASPDENSATSPEATEEAEDSEMERPSSSQPQEVVELGDGDDGFSGGSRQLFAEFDHHQRDVDRFNSRVRYEAESEDEDEDDAEFSGFQSSSEGSDSDSD
ncbi:hypothetical protein GCG54_00009366 [Colletotrichum gloeosporioides]|uniref:Uncharacterized protein n=1 Tax=Colletotrichum gloeosporioides TaxID=474922 RepID=A0A8H4C5B9_COLGL|nr:uncharacterized protein GCG54_00009366 [Colletotrichum gloeosporioides]KAF3797393.1 hypothetical protein GCG54_00009366 [Colletotrichum gloeosporioides]